MSQSPEEEDAVNVEIPIPFDIPLSENVDLKVKIDAGLDEGKPAVDGGSVGISINF